MPRRQTKPEAEQSIPEMVEDISREEMRRWYKDGKLTAYGRDMAKILDQAFLPEKVGKWGLSLTSIQGV